MRFLWLSSCLAASLTFAAPGSWSLDVAKTELVVKVWKSGAAAGLAHDHVVRASKVTGTATLEDGEKPETLALKLSVDVASLVPDEAELRKRHGVEGTVSEGDRQQIKEHLLDSGQLDVAKFPAITFSASKLTRAGAGLECVGQLTLHGVTKELRFPVTVKASANTFEADARVKLKTSDFGVKPYSTALGLINNRDEVELVVHLVLSRPG